MSLKDDSKAEDRNVLRTDLEFLWLYLAILYYVIFIAQNLFCLTTSILLIHFKVNFDLFQLAVFFSLSNNFWYSNKIFSINFTLLCL